VKPIIGSLSILDKFRLSGINNCGIGIEPDTLFAVRIVYPKTEKSELTGTHYYLGQNISVGITADTDAKAVGLVSAVAVVCVSDCRGN